MYMPYLHGKQEELLAVLALSPSLTNFIVPIFKPVNVDATNFVGRLARIGCNARYALITNSDKGPRRQPPTYADVVAVIREPTIAANAQNVFPAFEIRGDSSLADFDRFSRDFADRRCVVIHKSHTYASAQLRRAMHFLVDPVHVYIEPGVSADAYSSLPSAGRIVIRDGFNACERNSDYPAQAAFDDIVYQYRLRNFSGFGDFCMIGDTYSDSGGPANAVALHLTEGTGSALLTNHFVSRSMGVDTRTMYFEALRDLVSYAGAPPRAHLDTQGVREYLRSHADRHFPNLGPAKRWSTMHHIEVVQRILVSQNATALF
jgi:hypothetical protein